MPAEPTPEEVAAIVAAVEVVWPVAGATPAPAPPPATPRRPSPWRWSGRWWAGSQPRMPAQRRRRPWS